tara:strand:- start:1371 stop:1562 length:192 start_codon:yes stop_codon:yes gene_type:complete
MSTKWGQPDLNDESLIQEELEKIKEKQKTEIEIDLPKSFFSDVLHDGQHRNTAEKTLKKMFGG